MTAALGDGQTLKNDDRPLLHLTGNLFEEWGGTPIVADEPVRVKGKPEQESKGKQKGKK
jgi:hypothetical protein